MVALVVTVAAVMTHGAVAGTGREAVVTEGRDNDAHILLFSLTESTRCRYEADYRSDGSSGFHALGVFDSGEGVEALRNGVIATYGPDEVVGAWAGPHRESASPLAVDRGGIVGRGEGSLSEGKHLIAVGYDASAASDGNGYNLTMDCDGPFTIEDVVRAEFRYHSILDFEGGFGAALLPNTGVGPHATTNRTMDVTFDAEGMAVVRSQPCGGIARVGVASSTGYVEDSAQNLLSPARPCPDVAHVSQHVRAPDTATLSVEEVVERWPTHAWSLHWPPGALAWLDQP